MLDQVGGKLRETNSLCVRAWAGLTAVALLSVSFSSNSYASPIALTSSLDLSATSGRNAFEVIDTASASQGSSLNTLGLLSVNAESSSLAGTSITSGSASASWDSTSQGQVRFENLGWDNSGFSTSTTSTSSLAGTQWVYEFEADVTGQFYLDWNVSLHQALADSFGLQDFRFSLAGSAGSQTVMGVNTSGSATRNIVAGNQYTAVIQTNAGIFGGVGGRTSFMTGIFDWSMDAGPPSVPEPAPIALLGLGLIALQMSKRKPAKGV